MAEAGLSAIRTPDAVLRQVQYDPRKDMLRVCGRQYALAGKERVVVIGFGKAAFEAVSTLYTLLGARITCGFVLDLKGGSGGNLTCTIGSHPHPTVVNVRATQQIVQVVEALTEHDVLLCVVSGGGSSLLCSPYQISCEVQTRLIQVLFQHGATIQEINTVRKHISTVKGGQLAQAAFPAQVINLIFSDVPGDDPAVVASGPTLLDTTTVEDARTILHKYNVLEQAQVAHIALRETPKDPQLFEQVSSHIIVSARLALRAMQDKAEDLGYRARVYAEGFSGEARVLAQEFAAAPRTRECVLASGESTVHVAVPGKGGRNLEMALAALPHLAQNAVFLAIDSDGHDNTDFAGALADAETVRAARSLHIDPARQLDANSSYAFFEEVGDYIETGLTGANVADLVISLRQ
jgi:glycerate 2-kinase